ncbi:hypothetical protein DFH94DRAFT_129537 [Russula ochroleuca]|uniref:NACHT domain-containing protein n=1 Tax=Russula ochroleuca TaxID=152965 RepID=A0A9P5MNF5_9AGAM|nr:hypothetical protein DFH94DRAFT_129537 [Russula ochroleuca]
MSHAQSTASSSSPNFQLIINKALDKYKKRTKRDLLTHPLASQLQSCDSPGAILAILQQQVQGSDQSRNSDERWSRWLDPTVNVLYALSSTLGAGVGLVFSPATVIFSGIGVLLSAAKDVRASQDILIDIFERVEMFFRRLEIYIGVTPTPEMMGIIIQIMAEVLSILGIATKEIKQGRMKKYLKKLIGGTDIEDGLKRLDKLTQEESRMAAAENLKATHAVGERVKGVADTAAAIDNRVADVDDRVAGVDERVAGVVDQVAGVDDRVVGVGERVADVDERVAGIGDQVTGVDERVAGVDDRVQQTANDVDEIKRNQLRENIHKWLSPPDPSTNHNIACGTHHKKTATWFFQGSIFQEWKSTGSLLWIHGKPGSGKSIICSTVIQDIEAMCKAGQASMAYFYFDFRDANKQGLRDLVHSLLIQLSARSGPRCDILSDLYSAHDQGKNQPSDSISAKCLKEMLALPNQPPTYLIIDALDESPNAPGIPSPREMVLQLLEELVNLSLPNLHICVTSRPEIDIRNVLGPLASRRVSLHDQTGQKKDIADYIRSVVYSNSEQIMRRWRMEDKELVIETLSERADGMFRWAFCQLEALRYCLPPSVRRTLDELPESLDETYERVLKEIKKPNRDHARRLLQCLIVAIRPLDVKELAEVLAVDFDDTDGIPKLKTSWRWEDQEQALLSSCSSLITIVETDYSRVVQFSHFSVKEYLTSARLATPSADVSRYHVDLESAHTILAQACMSVLLQPDNGVEESGAIEKRSPLAGYAARHWVTHAQFERVSSFLRKAMEYLFDLDMPYFAAWLHLYDIDTRPVSGSSSLHWSAVSTKSGATPLYLAALCGFQDLAEHLVVKYPQHMNAIGGHYETPLVAALAGRHFQTANLLHHKGAHVNARSSDSDTALCSAAWYGDLEMVQVLLNLKVNVNDRGLNNWTPIHTASQGPTSTSPHTSYNNPQLLPDVALLLLEHGADVNARIEHEGEDDEGVTPLHLAAADYGRVEVVRVLLEHGANVGAEDNKGRTPLHEAADYRRIEGNYGRVEGYVSGKVELVRVLLEHGANVGAEDSEGRTSLHVAAEHAKVEVVRLLLEHGANVGAQDNEGRTPLHKAVAREYGMVEVIRVLLEHGANVGAQDSKGRTPFQMVSPWRNEIKVLLLEHGAEGVLEHDLHSTTSSVSSP